MSTRTKKLVSELTPDEEMRALELHNDSIVINGLDIASIHNFDHEYVDRIRNGGLTCGIKTVILHELRFEHYTRIWEDNDGAVRKISDYLRYIDDNPDRVLHATTAADIERAKQEGKYAVMFGFQNAVAIGDNLALLRAFHKLGLRVIVIAYNRRNAFADGAAEPANAGLSILGRRLVEEMNELGILVDLTHVGYQSSQEALELSTKPCTFSHSNANAVVANTIAKPDYLLRMCAEKGGVNGIAAKPQRLVVEGEATIEHFMDMVDYMVNLCGVEGVGLGLDTPSHWSHEPALHKMKSDNFIKKYPEFAGSRTDLTQADCTGLETWEGLPNISRGLVARGYEDGEIKKILGGNFLRLFRDVFGS